MECGAPAPPLRSQISITEFPMKGSHSTTCHSERSEVLCAIARFVRDESACSIPAARRARRTQTLSFRTVRKLSSIDPSSSSDHETLLSVFINFIYTQLPP